ncbi:MAG: hypothetical protein ACREDI_06775 [Roseiarcus sp.]
MFRAMEQVKMAAGTAGVSCEALREVHDQTYRAIIDAAHALRSHCHGLARAAWDLGPGSETVKVLTHSTIPVLVYR